jgi:carbon-monoxide dehydrogenase medium subunit
MRFNYLEPKTVEEAISLLSKYGGKAKVLAGGTDLLVQIKDKAIRPEYLVDISGITGLNYIDYDEGQGLRIGALTPVRALERSVELQRRYPVISQAASQLGSVAIRNVGTIGGNLCNAAPSAETAPTLIGLSARAKVIGPRGEKMVAVEDFFAGPGSTALEEGELLIEVQLPLPSPNTRGAYLKHGRRGTIDLAIVGVAAIIILESESEVCRDVKIVLGAVAPTPMRAYRAEEVLRGKKVAETLISESAEAAANEARPISDVRASAAYRKEMVKVITMRAITEAMAQPSFS